VYQFGVSLRAFLVVLAGGRFGLAALRRILDEADLSAAESVFREWIIDLLRPALR
jgi:hypothetical protein